MSAYTGPSGHNLSATSQYDDGQERILVQFDDTYILPSNTYQRSQWELDAQIAARKAMAKRSSRSYAARVSRTKSRKRDFVGRPAKPTIDTSFTKQRGALPRQVYPKDNDLRNGGTTKKTAWFGIGRSGTGRGLGIMKGTPQPESQPEDYIASFNTDPKTASTLSPGNKSWMEISPSDRPIPIGISLPPDSLPDWSPYEPNRKRSESDTTLVTPSIIITPAAAMKSVWSPDTESDYTPSIYSRGTFYASMADHNVPPVPALPDAMKSSNTNPTSVHPPDRGAGPTSHSRNGTLDSTGTAFDDIEFDVKRKDRIMSNGTVFEEDELPLRERNARVSNLSLDTSVVPTPRRSQGWWNYITTPFEFSRANSVWTQGGRNLEKTPDIPMLPQQFKGFPDSPAGHPSYVWSPSEKSPSVIGDSPDSPFVPTAFAARAQVSNVTDRTHASLKQHQSNENIQTTTVGGNNINNTINITGLPMWGAQSASQGTTQSSTSQFTTQSTTERNTRNTLKSKIQSSNGDVSESQDRDVSSPLSTMSASPVVGTAAIGTVLMPRQVSEQPPQQPQQHEFQQHQHQPQQQQPINVNIVIQDRRPDVSFQATTSSLRGMERSANTSPGMPVAATVSNVEIPTSQSSRSGPSQSPPQFAPPPVLHRQGSPSTSPEAGSTVQTSAHRNNLQNGSTAQYTAHRNSFQNGSTVQSTTHVNSFQNESTVQSSTRDNGFQNESTVKSPSHRNSFQSVSFQFPPPPRFSQSRSESVKEDYSRASSPVSIAEMKNQKHQKQHRKVFNIADWLPFGQRTRTAKKQKKDMSRRKKWCWGCCCCILILVLLAILIPVIVVVTRKQNKDPNNTTAPPLEGVETPATWLNLTGYPPMPTGISTIAQPEAVEEESGCSAPATVWSCAVPKEEQQAISPNKPDQPNLKLEIAFENGTVADPAKTLPAKRAANAVSAGAFIRSLLRARQTPSASPAAPDIEDYKFLGNTTDGIKVPFEGEETPFFISVLDTRKEESSSRLVRRADDKKKPQITDVIPPPKLNPDGTAAPANLFPVASRQPLRLFNRGKDDEHYGFFVYYDRSIFLKDTSANFSLGGNPADQDGGSPFDAATARCTWAQTRFRVQIWTRSQSKKPLLGSAPEQGSDVTFKRPGSFPYPVTITVDRHGGNSVDKMLYCYKMETTGKIIDLAQNKGFLFEDRKFGGNQIKPGGGPDRNVTGPIDGGSGGCRCQWQNWLA